MPHFQTAVLIGSLPYRNMLQSLGGQSLSCICEISAPTVCVCVCVVVVNLASAPLPPIKGGDEWLSTFLLDFKRYQAYTTYTLLLPIHSIPHPTYSITWANCSHQNFSLRVVPRLLLSFKHSASTGLVAA